MIEFGSLDDAQEGRARLLASGVLDRFADKDLPKIVEEAEVVNYERCRQRCRRIAPCRSR